MYLFDTNVVSEMRKIQTGRIDLQMQRWTESLKLDSAYLSAITLLELERGILRLQPKDSAQAAVRHHWLHDRVMPSFKDRMLVVDGDVALRCAALHVPVTLSSTDVLIAATALVHGLVVVTRNVKDYEPWGVKVLNPWVE